MIQKNQVKDLEKDIKELDIHFTTASKSIFNYMYSEDELFNKENVQTNYIISASGQVVPLNTAAISEYIPVIPGGIYETNSDRVIGFYKSDGALDKTADQYSYALGSPPVQQLRIVKIPTGINFIRLSLMKAWLDTTYFKLANTMYLDSVNVKHNQDTLEKHLKNIDLRVRPKIYNLRKNIVNASIQEAYIYAAIGDKIVRYKSDEMEETLLTIAGAFDWRCVWSDSDNNVYVSPFNSYTDDIAASDCGLWRYDGTSFSKVLALSAKQCIWGIDSDSNGNIYAGVYALGSGIPNTKVYKSTNKGLTFSEVFSPTFSGEKHCHCIVVDKSNDHVYASFGDSYGNKLNYASTNAGVNWFEILVGNPVNQYTAIIATETCRLFGTDQYGYGQIHRTTNNQDIDIVLDTHYQNVFFLRKSDITGFIYAGFKLDPASVTDQFCDIWYSKDDGITWEMLTRISDITTSDGFWFASNMYDGNLIMGLMENGSFSLAKGITESTQSFYSSDGLEGTKIKPFLKT